MLSFGGVLRFFTIVFALAACAGPPKPPARLSPPFPHHASIRGEPAATYLDIIAEMRRRFDVPLAAYHVSGEYSMIRSAARTGWLDEQAVVLEITSAIKRAGANLIITYFAEQLAGWI